MKYGLSESQLNEVTTILSRYEEIESALLFGSRAINTFKEASDVDMAIKGKKANHKLISDLKFYFEEETDLPFFFDFVSYPKIDNQNLKEHIDKYGIIIYRKGWHKVKLGEVVIFNPLEKLPKKSLAKKVLMDNLISFKRKVSGYTNELYKGGSKFRNGDTLVARITPCLENGKTAFVNFLEKDELGFGSTEFIVMRGKYNLVDKYYLFYFTISSYFRDLAIKSMTGSSGRQRVQIDELMNLEILLPPLSEQKAIAEVLSSLDDKIELLHEQNKTLEEMAQTLFHKWFIQDANPHWPQKPLSYFGYIICGKTPSKKIHKYFGKKIPFIKIPDMHGNTFVFKTEDGLSKSGQNSQSNKTIPKKSICVSCIATVGLISMNAFESQTNQQINSIIPKEDKYRYFIYLFMKSFQSSLEAMASGGTTTMNLNTSNFSKIMVSMPDKGVISRFQFLVEPLFNKIYHNQSQILNLEKLRNILLPKLITGSVRLAFKYDKTQVMPYC